MRRQYHLSPVGPGLFDAWDVHRLVALSRGLPVLDHPLASIAELDEVVWFDGGERPTLRAIVEHMVLVQAVDPSHPIILAADGRVMDGRHRVARALKEGRPAVPAVRFPVTPAPDRRGVRLDDLNYD